jgi:hypothetical protein
MILAASTHNCHLFVSRPGSVANAVTAEVPHDAKRRTPLEGLRMATILEFKSAPRPAAASMLAACSAAVSAEIVLFPGVRYERHEGDEDEAGAQATSDVYTRRHSDENDG